MNSIYQDIVELFEAAGVENFEKLPDTDAEKAQFAKLFKQFNDFLEAAKIQGFDWNKKVYTFKHEDGTKRTVRPTLDKNTYLILALRYKELFNSPGGGVRVGDVPYDIDTHLTESRISRNFLIQMQKRLNLQNCSNSSMTSSRLQKYKASIGIRKFTLLNMRMAQKERCVLHWIKIHI